MAGEDEIKRWRGTTVWDYYKENYGVSRTTMCAGSATVIEKRKWTN
jgi:hypothetical protein